MDPRADMDELLDAVLPFARQMVEEYGEFHPMGASMGADGLVAQVGAYTGEEFPAGEDVIELLTADPAQRAEQGELRGAAICANVTVDLPDLGRTDAIQVAIEHRDADPIIVLMPYAKKWLRGWAFRELIAGPGQRTIFP